MGTASLGHRGWATVRHPRTETWPITFEWLGASDNLFPSYLEQTMLQLNQESPVPSEGWPHDETLSIDNRLFVSGGDRPLAVSVGGSELAVTATLTASSTQQIDDKARQTASRRVKTNSECTESSLSQNMLELGPAPLEPSFPLPGKLTEKISNWFSTSSANTSTVKCEARSETKNMSGSSRRFSEGGKSGSSFSSRLRNSFNRKRSKTISAG